MEKHIPKRMCIACRQMKNQNELLRIVRDNASGEIVTDIQKKKFGRGAYICADEKCIKLAMKKKGIERHLKSTVNANLYEELISMKGKSNE